MLLLPTLLRAAPAGGTFVELGALDGRLFSNTYMLETCFGWRGVLVEPNPANFAALRASGRRATLVHSGACSTAGTIRMSVSGGAMAANVDHMSRRHRSMHRHRPTVSVPCEPLSSIMSRTGHPNATLLSLDVALNRCRIFWYRRYNKKKRCNQGRFRVNDVPGRIPRRFHRKYQWGGVFTRS